MASKIVQADTALITIVTQFEALWVREYLSPQAQKQYLSGHISKADLEPLALALREMSAAYVHTENFANIAFTENQALAYLFYYFPINLIKILFVLSQIPLPKKNGPLRVLDFGAGPGTASAAISAMFDTSLEFHAIEKNALMRTYLKKTYYHLKQLNSRIEYHVYSELADEHPPFDFIVLANVLCELESMQAQHLIDELCTRLQHDGIIFILDPALQATTRRLQAERDQILQKHKNFIPLFPCTRNDDCPMLKASSEDWCHGTLGWEPPSLVQQLDEQTGFAKHRLKYTAYAFQRGSEVPQGLRLITSPQSKGGRVHALVCGKNIYGEKVLPSTARRLRQYQIIEQ